MNDNGKWRRWKLQARSVDSLSDRALLLNLLLTQGATLILALGLFWIQHRSPLRLFRLPGNWDAVWLWGIGLAVLVLAGDLLLSRWVPEEVTDDGGINDKLFANRGIPAVLGICLMVAFCEELLFRGAVQHAIGAYWTSIIFASIHFRYLRHWLMTGMVFAISYGMGWIMVRTGTIWAPIAAHFVIDAVMGLIIRYRRD